MITSSSNSGIGKPRYLHAMGCFSSSPRVSPVQRPKQLIPPIFLSDEEEDQNAPPPIVQPVDVKKFLHDSVFDIIQGITRIPSSEYIRPLVVLDSNAIALATASLCLERGDVTNVSLPIATISLLGKGRAVTLGGLEILANCLSSDTESSAFLENIVQWVSGATRASYRVLLFDIVPDLAARITKNLRGFDFSVDTHFRKETFSAKRFNTVICGTDNHHPDLLLQYVQDGGGLICCYTPSTDVFTGQNFMMRPVLHSLGIGFPECSLIIGSTNGMHKIEKLEKVIALNLPALVDQYVQKTAESTDLDNSYLDYIVTTLSYHITVLPQENNQYLLKLAEAIWNYLRQQNYQTEEGLCPLMKHRISVVLLSDIFPRFPANTFLKANYASTFHSDFPGDCGEVSLTDFAVRCEFSCPQWFSTGLYLPPGVIARVELHFPQFSPHSQLRLIVQIGAHTENLLSKTSPWKRWALIVTRYEAEVFNLPPPSKPPRTESLQKLSHSREPSVDRLSIERSTTSESIQRNSKNPKHSTRNSTQDSTKDSTKGSTKSSTKNSTQDSAKNSTTNSTRRRMSIAESLSASESCFTVTDTEECNYIEIGSPFGGPIYIVAEELTFDGMEEAILVDATLIGVTRLPVYCVNDPLAWEETSKIDVPLSEIETKFVCLTLPTSEMKKLEDKHEFCEFIDSLLSNLLMYLCDDSQRLYRVVFDADLARGEPLAGYPIVMHAKSAQNLLHVRGPSEELLNFLRLVAESSLPEGAFAEEEQRALAYLGAIHTFKQFWPDEKVLKYVSTVLPQIFHHLSTIFKKNPQHYTNTIKSIRQICQMTQTSTTEMWNIFVKLLGQSVGKDLTKELSLLQKSKSDSMENTFSSASLMEFQLEDSDPILLEEKEKKKK